MIGGSSATLLSDLLYPFSFRNSCFFKAGLLRAFLLTLCFSFGLGSGEVCAASGSSIFTGEVPQSCLIEGFDGERELSYQAWRNSLYGEFGFTVTTNAENIQLGLAPVRVNREVGDGVNAATGTGGIVDMDAGLYLGSYHTTTSSKLYAVPMTPGVGKSFEYRFGAGTSQKIGDKNQLLPGAYSFTVVLSCYMS